MNRPHTSNKHPHATLAPGARGPGPHAPLEGVHGRPGPAHAGGGRVDFFGTTPWPSNWSSLKDNATVSWAHTAHEAARMRAIASWREPESWRDAVEQAAAQAVVDAAVASGTTRASPRSIL